jgi:ribosomal protein L7Ae-like RNA K-turn-binding protein
MTAGQLRLLGLGARAGTVVVGTSGVRAALQRGDVGLVVVASDFSERTADKVVRLAEATGIRVLSGPSAVELGRSVGRGRVQALGVRDRNLATGIIGTAARRM